ncbi:MAG: nitrite reductase small subunit NirD [Rhodospirillaceae bacterium]|jgi:nitrite reductase (NADH) small subunit|nr:nitrite reductase small subunit NirD [Rhodospirillaceae bacterium]MBT5374380.1 nitrite reductase small subunit NirD [Rhodospirillaceae bacterium]MBT5659841.1 nitrite reductase small subunit NirD [Rhodospirillaceae bacterium]MBT5751594.1 nitrite reductase small subunit NirD [Rhodospirillaceae bacterium]
MSEWIEICTLEDIPLLGARVIETGESKIALFRTSEDEVFALKDECPHKKGPLSQGIVHGKRVTCPLHNRVLELEDGAVIAPDVGCAQPYRTKNENGKIFIFLSRTSAIKPDLKLVMKEGARLA